MSRVQKTGAFDSGDSQDTGESEVVAETVADSADETTDNPPEQALWFSELYPGGSGQGFLEKNNKHSLVFASRPNRRLLVTFDNLSNVKDKSVLRDPWAYKFARDMNVSHLGVMAHVADWYRDPDLIERFRALADSGFFEGYERVIFAGTSMGAFAAIAFASLVPGSHVVALNPQSTLDTDLVPWETRFWSGRRQDWSLPLSDAAALTGDIGRVNIFYDPYFEPDHKHVARFSGDNIRIFKCWYSSHKSAVFLRKIDGLKPIMHRAIFDELTDHDFYKLYRGRRYLPWYRGTLAQYFIDRERPELADRLTKVFRENLREHQKTSEAKENSEFLSAPSLSLMPFKNDNKVIVTTMKNEGPFMLEWIAFNKAIGFTDFIIYTNHCDDGTDKIAMRLEELGVAHHCENVFRKGASPQRVALRKSAKHPAYQSADWLLCADCDEFLNVRVGDGNLDDLIAATPEADAISVCWKLFGNSGIEKYQDELIVDQFDWATGENSYPNFRSRGIKTLVRRNEKLERLKVHRPAFSTTKSDLYWVDGGGQAMPANYLDGGWKGHKNFSHDNARLHHYAVRSVDSFLVKRDRGRTNHVTRDQGEEYWSNMNYNEERDVSIKTHIPATRKFYKQLLADSELKKLHQAACHWHVEKIKDLRAQKDWEDFGAKIAGINALPVATEN